MPLGFVVIGMALGLVAAIVALVGGAGFGLAVLVYSGGGCLGVGLAVVCAMIGRWEEPHQADSPAPVS